MTVVSITPEIALDEFPVYAGGLGVLEADKFYAAAAGKIPYVVFTLFHPKGYVEYEFTDNGLVPRPQFCGPEKFSPESEITFPSALLSANIVVKPYSLVLGKAKVVFFHVVEPEKAARSTERLYVYEEPDSRELSAIILAKATSIYIRERVGVENVAYVDLQESLGALITYLLPELRNKIRFVVHTIAPWTNFTVNQETVKKEIPEADLSSYGSSLYYLAMDRTSHVFAVSAKHEKLVKQISPPFSDKITHATNGVNIDRWTHPEIMKVLESGTLSRESFAAARKKIRKELEKFLHIYKRDISLDDDVFVVAWPRRVTRYKRPYFVERLIADVSDSVDAFFVLGGKSHPFDGDGQYFMNRFKRLHDERPNVVYLHDYDVSKAKLILSSVDLLLFTPFPGWEACGTSYMKAGVNGVPTLSSRDGGVLEAVRDGYNGWLFGKELDIVVNIYTDHEKTSGIDQHDYQEMLQKFKEIYKLYTEKPETYQQIQLNAFQSMREKFDIRKTLQTYYGPLL